MSQLIERFIAFGTDPIVIILGLIGMYWTGYEYGKKKGFRQLWQQLEKQPRQSLRDLL